MGARFLGLMAVMVLCIGLAGCTDKKKDAVMVNDGASTTTQQTDGTQMTTTDGQYAPGSQAQLVAEIGDRVYFGYDQYDLTAEARSTVERQAQWMKTYPNVSVMVEGHCDERGTREYNLALGEKRATAVRNYLISNGVQAGRVQSISYGKERPAIMGADETSWAQNRRGVLVVQ
ncbi:MAG: peptidoglycan-associated lipoprotein Pal [bacterium]|nr:peptidoglycan-associated lipoprotein Pal [bacterium]